MQTLLKAKASVNVKDKDGNTALMQAAERDHVSTVQALLEAKASVNEQTHHGWTALMSAKKKGHIKIITLLEEAESKSKNKSTEPTSQSVIPPDEKFSDGSAVAQTTSVPIATPTSERRMSIPLLPGSAALSAQFSAHISLPPGGNDGSATSHPTSSIQLKYTS